MVHFDHGGKHFHVIDTPGYPDFIGQTIGAMRGVDTAAIVINAQSGIEVNTRRVFAEAEKAGLGRMIVINKMDAENIDFPALVDSIQELFGTGCVLLNVPLGHGADFRGVASTLKPPDDTAGALVDPAEISESLMESIIEVDEEVMERYFEGTPPTDEELSRLIVRAVAEGTPDSDRVRVGQDGRRACRSCSTRWPCAPCRPARSSARPRTPTAKRSRSRPIRPARWWPRSSRPASTRSCRS